MDNEQLPVENLKGEPKPYTFRKVAPDEKDAEGNTVKRSPYKVLDRATGKPYEGFEDKEFESPLHGGRYFHSLFKEVDAKADADAKIAPVADPPDSGNKPFNIPIIGEEPVIHVFGTKYYEMVIHEQDGDAKRKDIFVTDGCSRDFLVKFDVPVILPAG